jgi:hypothetical protein
MKGICPDPSSEDQVLRRILRAAFGEDVVDRLDAIGAVRILILRLKVKLGLINTSFELPGRCRR